MKRLLAAPLLGVGFYGVGMSRLTPEDKRVFLKNAQRLALGPDFGGECEPHWDCGPNALFCDVDGSPPGFDCSGGYDCSGYSYGFLCYITGQTFDCTAGAFKCDIFLCNQSFDPTACGENWKGCSLEVGCIDSFQ